MNRFLMARLMRWLCWMGSLMGFSGALWADELLTIPTRPGVELKVLLLEPETPPKGVLIAYVGGDGTLGLATLFGKPVIGNASYEQGFLVRNRHRFVEAGYAVMLPDVPSDRKTMNYIYRLGQQQVDDALPLIDLARQRYGKNPWLLGTSASSMTVGNLGSNPDATIGGIVLAASVTTMPSSYGAYRTHPEGTASTRLQKVKVPALVLAHQEDACELSPPADTSKLMERLTASTRKAERLFTGGFPPKSGACFALSPHGFYGIEEQVEQVIFDFIQKPGS